MVMLASRNIYPIEVPKLFAATLIPITAAAETSSLETHLSSDTLWKHIYPVTLFTATPALCCHQHLCVLIYTYTHKHTHT